jgi:hypothetical protein
MQLKLSTFVSLHLSDLVHPRPRPCTDLRPAMTAAIDRLTAEGWQPEGTPDFGFVFINRNRIRRRLILTERDPPVFLYSRRAGLFGHPFPVAIYA